MVKPYAFLAMAVTAFSLTGVLAEVAAWDSFSHVGLRSITTTGAMAVFSLVVRDLRWPSRLDILAGAGCGLASAIFVITTTLSNSPTAAVLAYSAPPYGGVIVWVLKGHRPSAAFWGCSVLILIGLGFIACEGGVVPSLVVVGLGTFGAICFAVWAYCREVAGKERSDQSIPVGFLIAAVIFLVMPSELFGLPRVYRWNMPSIVAIVAGGLLTALAYAVMSRCINRDAISSRVVLIISSLEVPLMVMWSYICLGRIPGTWALVGGVLVLSGALFIGLHSMQQKEKP